MSGIGDIEKRRESEFPPTVESYAYRLWGQNPLDFPPQTRYT